MNGERDDDIERDVAERMERAPEGDDAERLRTLEEVQETLEGELGEGGETQPTGH